MRYLGGKTCIAKDIANLIKGLKGNRATYIEPFLGGASVFEAVSPMFPFTYAGDASEDLILMWKEAAAGWVPPENVTEEEYQAIRKQTPSALRGFVGFGCSFGAKWFGGYARDRQGTNYAAQSSRAVVRKATRLALATSILCQDYSLWEVGPDCVVYADPPYQGTQGYGAVGTFDHRRFWETMDRWSNLGALVLVSEYTASTGWTQVWEKSHRQQLCGLTERPKTTERVFARVP